MKKLYRPTSKTFSKMAGGRRYTLYPTPWICPGHKLQKPSNKSGIVQSPGTTNFVLFLLKDIVKRGGPGGGRGMVQYPHPKNTLLTTLHLFCDMIIMGKGSTIAFSAIDKLVALF